MKYLSLLVIVILFAGCASVPYDELDLDTTTDFTTPTTGKSGIYVYQWKTGILGSALDVGFQIKGFPEVHLNTGEYSYFEIPPGEYEYKYSGGLIDKYTQVKVEANKNYFFKVWLFQLRDMAALIRDQTEINEAKQNILDKRYEEASVD